VHVQPLLAEPEIVHAQVPRLSHDGSIARGNAGGNAGAQTKTASDTETHQISGVLQKITLRARWYTRRYRCRPEHRSRHARNFESCGIAGNDFSASRMDIFRRSSAADSRRGTLFAASLLGTLSGRAVSRGVRRAHSDP